MTSREIIEAESGFWTPPAGQTRPFAAPTTNKDRHQDIMDRAYKRWQPGGDLEKEGSKNRGMDSFFAALEDPDKLAVEFGKLNQQVLNGGFTQWIGNGYADASFGDLLEYVDKYGSEYPAIAKVGKILKRINDQFEDANSGRQSFDTLSDWLEHDPKDEILNAIQEKDWDKLNDLLGGTDLDARKFKLAVAKIIQDNTSTEIYSSNNKSTRYSGRGGDDVQLMRRELAGKIEQEAPAPTSTSTQKWSFRINLDSDDNHDETTLWDAGEHGDGDDIEELWYDSEEEAEEASENFQLTAGMLDQDGEDEVEQRAINDLCDEYGGYGENDKSLFHNLDDAYSRISDSLLAEITKLLDDKFPESASQRAKIALAKAWGAVKAKTADVKKAITDIPGTVKNFGGRVKRAGQAAVKAFSAKESLEVVALTRD